VLSSSFDQILAYFIVPTIAFLGFTVTAVFVLRRGSPTRPPLRTPGFPISPLVFLASILMLLFLLILDAPREALTGLFIVLLGVPVAWRIVGIRRSSPDQAGFLLAGDVPVAVQPSSESSSVSTTSADS
jgi:APA family basic amino acid/polyamine antiporter